jgi:hypothetical protein
VKASVAAVKIARASAPAATARLMPRSFGTRTGKRIASRRGSARTTSSASASWGIALGRTKLVASISVSPAAPRSSMNRSLSEVVTG